MDKNVSFLLGETEAFMLYEKGASSGWSLLNVLLIVLSLLLAVYCTASWLKGKSFIPKEKLTIKEIVLRQVGVYLCLIVNAMLLILTSGGFAGTPCVMDIYTVIIISFLVVETGLILIVPQAIPE